MSDYLTTHRSIFTSLKRANKRLAIIKSKQMNKLLLLILSIFTFLSFQDKKEVSIKIESDKKTYRIGDTIKLKIVFDNKTNKDLVIAFREGDFPFNKLSISQDGIKIKFAGLCKFKTAPLGFWESDYHKLNSKDSVAFEMKLELINFPTKRDCFDEKFYPSGYGILNYNQGVIFNKLGKLNFNFIYNVKFPCSKQESTHSAYHKHDTVLNQSLVSNSITILVKE